MFFYIFLFFCVIISSLRSTQNKEVGIFWFVVLCLFSMFRGETVGTDTAAYMDVSEMISAYQLDLSKLLTRSMEVVTVYLYELVYNYSLPPRLIIVFFSLITFIFLYLSIKKLELSYNVGIVVFLILFYLTSFNIARQICACSIILYGFTFLFENTKQRYFYLVFVFLASLIHAASFFYIFLYVVRIFKDINIDRTLLTFFAIFLFLLNVISPLNMTEYLTSVFGDISFSEIYSDRAVTNSRTIIGIMQDFVKFFTLILIFNYGELDSKDTLKYLFFYLIIITTIFSGNADSDIARVFLPLEFYIILHITYLFKIDEYFIKSITFVFFVFVYTFLTLWGASTGSGEVIPYVFSIA